MHNSFIKCLSGLAIIEETKKNTKKSENDFDQNHKEESPKKKKHDTPLPQ